MDITLLFKACVKTIRTRNKALGVNVPELDKHRILNNHKSKHSEFTCKAKEVLNQITKLRDFLLEHRKAYLNFSHHLSTLPQINDYERDKIDNGAQRIIKTCSHHILEFKRDATFHEGHPQLIEHQDAVIDLLDSYLKTVCKIYSEQKAIRMKRNLELQKMARLESEVLNKVSRSDDSVSDSFSNEDSEGEETITRSPSKLNVETNSVSSLTLEDELTAEELQMFESENEQLYNELNSLTDEVRQIETKVVHIAELQEVFTEKVLEQEKDIERIFGTVVGTTENLRDANTQIRQAIQSNAGLRLYVLFFLLVMSLTLLFLDWYND
ncbi:syntaxin-18-like [Homalodisca vitripennis]|uniref:syntaxin-18-like n=1 Tax=Homalodisca vitripennis TaxID=197043 RepID=UPI001EEC65C8|nr:syntaxin-18-like [Homalodisca vitripennis]XP_046678207.1 syntaxin-18-like [Homalodisca vitripennis]